MAFFDDLEDWNVLDTPQPAIMGESQHYNQALQQQQQQQQAVAVGYQQQQQPRQFTPAAASLPGGFDGATANRVLPQKAAGGQHSGVDGIGMWKSWCHNYNSPKFACLDLLDNCFDATLRPEFHGKVTMDYLLPNGLIITNNAANEIKSLEETLTAYRSEKSAVDAIGEYGVGLKQACATLSNINFVLTRNRQEFDFGVIAQDLQTRDSVSLPHFPFTIATTHQQLAGLTEEQQYQLVSQLLHEQVSRILLANPHIHNLVTQSIGGGDRQVAIEQLVKHCTEIYCNQQHWKDQDHVFRLIITQYKHASSEASRDASTGMMGQPAKNFLNEIHALLPKHYINVPVRDFDFYIMGERVHFVYWQNRLVEMTKFEVNIPKETALADFGADENWMDQGYCLSIYCGFDAIRFGSKGNDKSCHLCIYSRQSGRLIEIDKDCRAKLGLPTGSVDFTQGLTVIIDDVAGELPLKPAKDGLTWSKEDAGAIHEGNMYAWAGAVARVYWEYHAKKFETITREFKSALRVAIQSFMEPMQSRIQEQKAIATTASTEEAPRLELAKFTQFSEFPWYIKHIKNSEKIEIRKKAGAKKIELWEGPATVFRITNVHYQQAKKDAENNNSASKPRGRSSLVNNNHLTPVGKPSGKPRGRPSTTNNLKRKASVALNARRRSSASTNSARRTSQMSQQQPNSDDSSSGSEEEEEVTTVLATPKKPRTNPIRKPRNNSKAPTMIGMITPQHGDDSNDSARVKELEKELANSQEKAKRLDKQLTQATQKLLMYHKQNPEKMNLATAQRRLRESEQENARLKQENQQQAAQIDSLKLELQQRGGGGGGSDFFNPPGRMGGGIDEI